MSLQEKTYAGPQVVVSIKPIHSLVCGVMKGVEKPTLLIDGVVSPHVYSLKPGEASQLENAALIIWVGPAYETVLQNKMSTLQKYKKVLTLMDLEGMVLYSNRTGELWGNEDASEYEEKHHHSCELDGHIWLAPNNARLMVAAIARELGKMDPVHASLYEQNALETIQKIDALTQEILKMVEGLKHHTYMIFHDGTQYFDRYFGTRAVGAIVREPDLPPTIPHLKKVLDYLQAERDTCLFAEPQFDSKLVKQIAQDTGHTVYQLDYLGTDLTADEQTYFDLMRRFSNALVKGLNGCSLDLSVSQEEKCQERLP